MASEINRPAGRGVRIGLAVFFASGGALMTATRAMHWDDPVAPQSHLASLARPMQPSVDMPGDETACDEPSAAGSPVAPSSPSTPSTRPAEPRSFGGYDPKNRPPGQWPWFRSPTPRAPTTQPEPTAGEVAEFMEKHSPHKWAAFKAIPEQFRNGFLAGITSRYKEFKRLEAEDKPGFELELRQAKLEDQIFEAAMRYRAAKEDGAKQGEIRAETRELVKTLTGIFQEKRQHQLELVESQITSLQSQIKDLQTQADWLSNDLNNSRTASASDVEKKIDRRVEDYLNPPHRMRGGPGWSGRGPGGDRGGPGGDRGDRPERFDRGSTTRPSRDGQPGGPGRFGPPPGPPPQ